MNKTIKRAISSATAAIITVTMFAGCAKSNESTISKDPRPTSSVGQQIDTSDISNSTSEVERDISQIRFEKTVVETDELGNETIEYIVGGEQFKVVAAYDMMPVLKKMLELGFTNEEIYDECFFGIFVEEKKDFSSEKSSVRNAITINIIETEEGTIKWAEIENLEKCFGTYGMLEMLDFISDAVLNDCDTKENYNFAVEMIDHYELVHDFYNIEEAEIPFLYDDIQYDLSSNSSIRTLVEAFYRKKDMNGVASALSKYAIGEISYEEFQEAFDDPKAAYDKYVLVKDTIIDPSNSSHLIFPSGEIACKMEIIYLPGREDVFVYLASGPMLDGDICLDNENAAMQLLSKILEYENVEILMMTTVYYKTASIINADYAMKQGYPDFDINFDFGTDPIGMLPSN